MFFDIHWMNLRIMAEILLAAHLIARFLPHREYWLPRLILSSLGCLLLAWVYPLPPFAEHHYVLWGLPMYASFFWALVGSIAVCYQEAFLPVFCCGIIGYTIHQCASDLDGVLYTFCTMAGINVHPAVVWGVTLLIAYIPSYWVLSKPIRDTGQIRIDSK